MATGGDLGSPKYQWPLPISIDDDAKPGYCWITLGMEELAVSKGFMAKEAKVENGEVDPPIFKADEVTVTAKATDKSGAIVHYRYHKKLPENIDPENSRMKIILIKEPSPALPKLSKGRVQLQLKKEPNVSWVPHTKYLSMRPEKDTE